ncbi:SCP domain-containing protein [Caenorhabditis elegans]|uniref:SCP domain-containing protein n=1 Tax=Caenorhabditis elegans TaxID=6239 RepID=O76663_CAEEL|nr:SCP domain-containing protein [Caenorhabditis elegans]CCD62173.2 SCP domain-containing protein [Caenorhabditis elegans]|eukprot:NP_499859.3 SCP-Like extracellular protein [Caenorhabditis elegans]
MDTRREMETADGQEIDERMQIAAVIGGETATTRRKGTVGNREGTNDGGQRFVEDLDKGKVDAGTGSVRDTWQMRLKGVFIAVTVITLSYNILAASTPRPSRFSVITKMAPAYCRLNLPARLQNLILDKHNEIRSQVALGQYAVDDDYLPPADNMVKLDWDCELELEAQQRAQQCNLQKENSGRQMNGWDEVRGENAFYFRTTDGLDVSGAVLKGIQRMGDEIAIAGIKNLKLSRYDSRIGHATQILWKETRKLGCAVQECPARQDGSLDGQKYNVAVCKYYPTGNVFKSSTPTSIYSVGDVASACSEGTFGDPSTGLCVAATWQEGSKEK